MLKKQSGFAALSVTLILMLISTLAILSAAKGVFYGQKAANNAYQYSQALAGAQAGVDQGLAYLSNTTGTGLKRSDIFDSTTSTLLLSKFPLTGTLSSSRAGFSIAMSQPDITNNPYAIKITSTGCADGCTACSTNCPASATVSQIVQFRNIAMHTPDDALIARGSITTGGSVNVTNTTGKGVAARAGGLIATTGAASMTGGIAPLDTPLAQTSGDAFFSYFFGGTKDAVKAELPNYTATFPPIGTVGGAYWIDGDTANHGGIYGSPEQPVVLIVNGNLQINGNTVIYGLVYVIGGTITGSWNNSGGGTANIYGAAVSEGSFNGTGNLTMQKDPAVLAALKGPAAPAKLVASWKDF